MLVYLKSPSADEARISYYVILLTHLTQQLLVTAVH